MLWFVVNTDLTITTEKLVELFATVEDRLVGIGIISSFPMLDEWLDLPQSKVAEMKGNYHSPSQRREAYLDLYATCHPCPSWRQVAEVLRTVGLYHQADVVKSTYVQGTRMIPIYSLSVSDDHRICSGLTCPSQFHYYLGYRIAGNFHMVQI